MNCQDVLRILREAEVESVVDRPASPADLGLPNGGAVRLIFDNGILRVYCATELPAEPRVASMKGAWRTSGYATLTLASRDGENFRILHTTLTGEHYDKHLAADEMSSLLPNLKAGDEEDAASVSERLQALLQQPIEGQPAYRNRGLFSDDYLDHRLLERDEWRADVSEAHRRFRELYEDRKEILPTLNEADTEVQFLEPALDILGFSYTRQATTAGGDKPDYALFANTSDRDAALRNRGTTGLYSRSLSVLEGKHWGRSLDRSTKQASERETFTSNVSPEMQLLNYLRDTRLPWGILTNGTEWRLYHGYTPGKTQRYYSITLEDALENEESFRRFYLFFRRAAFVLQGPEPKSFLDTVLEESEEYAVRVGKDLKEIIFTGVFPSLARGFLEYRRQKNWAVDDEALDLVYRGSLALLYRLLFLLYAESRDLLPARDTYGYGARSMTRIKHEVAENRSSPHVYTDSEYTLWHDLKNLFEIVNEGNKNLKVPAYNGGLFKDEGSHALLAEHRISDKHLSEVIDALSRRRDEESGEYRNIDYGFVGVRELGSVYEGLLEFSLQVAEEDLVVVKKDGNEVYKPKSSHTRGRTYGEVDRGQPYLVNDKKERKATGSYYTPRYIVDYIIENTLGPLVTERRAALEGKLEEIRQTDDSLKRSRKSEEYRASERRKARPLETLLDVKVLDPALGSGHFLVAAVDYLTDEFASVIRELDAGPVMDQIEELREQIQGSLREYGVTVGEDQLSDTTLLKRMVMKRCVYGVDPNEMAVELAKLSLWLDAFTVGAPLSFLDHHLKRGNSLIGSSAREIRQEVERSGSLFGNQFTATLNQGTELMRYVGEISDATEEAVRESAMTYEKADEVLKPYKRMLDIWTSQHFGNDGARNFIATAASTADIEHLMKGDYEHFKGNGRKIIDAALRLSDNRDFFHWELEFPEVFFDENAREQEAPGFDAVVGNPPYVSAMDLSRTLSSYEKPFWRTRFQSASGAYDLYILFLEQATKLTRDGCLASMITSNKFMSAPFGIAFREYVGRNVQLLQLLDLSHIRAFEDPSVYPVVSLMRCATPENSYPITVNTALDSNDLSEIRSIEQHSDDLYKLPEAIWGFLLSEHLPLILKVEPLTTQLQHHASVRASSTAGEADAFADVLTESPNGESKKFVNTGLIERFHDLWGKHELTHKGVTYDTPYLNCSHPAVPAQRKIQYDKPKIAFAKMARRIEAFYDDEGTYASANTNFAYETDIDLRCLTAILNSKLMSTIYAGYFGALIMQGGYFQFQAPQLRVLPIPKFTSTAVEIGRWSTAEEVVELYEARDYPAVMRRVEQELGWTPEAGHAGEGRNDTLHYLLSRLAEEMNALHKERLEIQHTWREWVEAAVPQAERLTKRFLNGGWVEVGCRDGWEGVKAEFQSRGAIPSGKTLQDLKRETEEALAELCPLRQRIEETDRLIDQIVYRLYGLTEEEIQVVEESMRDH